MTLVAAEARADVEMSSVENHEEENIKTNYTVNGIFNESNNEAMKTLVEFMKLYNTTESCVRLEEMDSDWWSKIVPLLCGMHKGLNFMCHFVP